MNKCTQTIEMLRLMDQDPFSKIVYTLIIVFLLLSA